MEECRQEWLSRPREEPPTDQAAAQAGRSSATDEAAASQAGQRTDGLNLAAAPWENAGNPLLAGCSRPRCGSCGITLKTGELACPFCPRRAPSSNESAPPGSPGSSGARSASDEDVAELRRKRCKAQMRLVSLGRGDIKPRLGEPQCL